MTNEQEITTPPTPPHMPSVPQILEAATTICNSLLLYNIVSRVLRKNEIEVVFKISRNMCKQNINVGDSDSEKVIDEVHDNIAELIRRCDNG